MLDGRFAWEGVKGKLRKMDGVNSVMERIIAAKKARGRDGRVWKIGGKG